MQREKNLRILTYVLAISFAIIWILPLLWMLSTALKPESQVISWPIEIIPKEVTFENFYDIIFDSPRTPILRWFFNSFFVSTATTFLVLAVDSLAAYAYARLEFKGKNILFWLLMATMMVPPVTNLIPNYLIMDRLGWIDSYQALIFPQVAAVFGVFLMRQFFIGLPSELEDAAYIDGCNRFQIFYIIALPIAKPALIALGLFTFRASWNAFLWPLIITNSARMRPLTPGLRLLQSNFMTEFGKLMAGAFISAIPVIIIFIIAQKYFVKGIALTGMKG